MYHSDSILDVVSKRPGHSFGTIPIYADAKLLDDLKKLVTLKPAGSVTQASGIPNDVKKRRELAQVTMKLDLVARNMKNLVDMVKEAVKTAINDKIAESGQITASRVLEIMDEKFKAYQVHVNQGLADTLKEELQKYIPNFEAGILYRDQSGCGPSSMRVAKSRDVMYGYAGQMWDVPKGFVFPQQTNLKLAWMM